jgi:hypothetical protein
MGVRVRTAEEGALAMKISRVLDRRLDRCLTTDKISGFCSVADETGSLSDRNFSGKALVWASGDSKGPTTSGTDVHKSKDLAS